MPIDADLEDAYPDDWDDIRAQVLERATRQLPGLDEPTPCCERCGKPDGHEVTSRPDGWTLYRDDGLARIRFDTHGDLLDETWDPIITVPDDTTTVVLTVMHLCQDPRCDWMSHLRAACQRCHLEYDQQEGQRERRKRIQAEIRGQMSIVGSSGCPGGRRG
ncbi:MAG: hypothetical protein ABEN55_00055 [Bradymonadaceae bacterium]